MAHTFYVDTSNDYQYNWALSSNAPEVIRLQTGAMRVTFIANGLAKLTKGDCYRIEVPTVEDELLFVLKTGFDIANRTRIDEYLEARGL